MKNKEFLISMTVLWGMVFGSAMHSLTMGICMGLMMKGNELQEQNIWFRYVL